MKKILFHILRLVVVYIPLPTKIRDMCMWPITSRLLSKDFAAIIDRPQYKIKVDLKDQLNRMLLFFGGYIPHIWEPQTTKLARLLIQNKKNSIIAGAHIGYIDLEVAHSLQTDAHIFTFEPAAYLYERAKENISLNNFTNIHLTRAALGSEEGMCRIYVEDLRSSINPYSSAHRTNNNVEEVKQITLDGFKKQQGIARIDFLFLDVEGHEFFVFKGGEGVIDNDRPVIIFEVSPKILGTLSITKEELFETLYKKGYRLYAIEDNYHLDRIRGWENRAIKLIPISSYAIVDSYINVLAIHEGDVHTQKLVKPFII